MLISHSSFQIEIFIVVSLLLFYLCGYLSNDLLYLSQMFRHYVINARFALDTLIE